jgi:exodeoxyribonuclease III
MRVVGWNVQQGGGPRIARLMSAMATLDADILVLSEHRWSSSLARTLADHGWIHQVGTPDPAGGYAAVLVASRYPLRRLDPRVVGENCSQRWAYVEVVGREWAIAGALIPGIHRDHPTRKAQFWDFVLSEFAPVAADRPSLLIGDLNTGLHGIDEIGATLRCAEHMAALRSAGWVDVWHDLNPSERPPSTWWEPATGNGFRLDHAFLSPASPRAISIDYPLEIGGEATTRAGARKVAGERAPLSDHVPVVVELA